MRILTANDQYLVEHYPGSEIPVCGCTIPFCASPRVEWMTEGTQVRQDYGYLNSDESGAPIYDPHYRTERREWTSGRWEQDTWDKTFSMRIGPTAAVVVGADPVLTSTSGGTGGYPPPMTVTHSNPQAWADVLPIAEPDVDAAVDWADPAKVSTHTTETLTPDYVTGKFPLFTFREDSGGMDTPLGLVKTYLRYRLAPPADFSTTDAPRTFFKCQWDEVEFSQDWEDWEARKVEHAAQVDAYNIAKAAWDTCMLTGTTATCGTEPVNPGPFTEAEPSPAPSVRASREWTWGGSMTDPWSDWFVMSEPSDATDRASVRICNFMIQCYRSTAFGVKPYALGEVYP